MTAAITDPLERVIRPIVEGQLRGFVKEHPSVLHGVTWYKPRADKSVTLVNSIAKRVVRDLLAPKSRERIAAALIETYESAVEDSAAADGGDAGILAGVAPRLSVPPASADDDGSAGHTTGRPVSHPLLPAIDWTSSHLTTFAVALASEIHVASCSSDISTNPK